jgi:hypothetical protein
MVLLGEVVFDISRVTSESTTLAFVGYHDCVCSVNCTLFCFSIHPGDS